MIISEKCLYMLAGGFILDLIFGDPEGMPHLIILTGKLISFFEKLLYPKEKKSGASLFIRGALLVFAVLSITASLTGAVLFLSYRFSKAACIIAGSLISWQCLAVKSLKDHSMRVYNALPDIKGSRKAVSMIVGRDTESLDSAGVIRAAVESVAESTCDGIIAPLFYIALFGPLGGIVYKAANTMDSMIGYRNERYEYFGKTAARLDDIINLIPSRLAALLMIGGAFIIKDLSGRNALKTWLRDRNSLKSPNAGQTEAAASGALSLRLSGPASYGGVIFDKPYIGREYEREPEATDIKRINSLMYLTAIVAVLISAILLAIF